MSKLFNFFSCSWLLAQKKVGVILNFVQADAQLLNLDRSQLLKNKTMRFVLFWYNSEVQPVASVLLSLLDFLSISSGIDEAKSWS